jgi:23S rRNA (pseudouridine1915-N3)-methyltransferase
LKIHLVFVGKTTEKYLLEGMDDFINRLSRYASVTVDVVKASTIRDIKKAMEEEEKNILARLLPGDYLVILDEKGSEMTSRLLAGRVQKWMAEGRNRIVFIIGGAFGIAPSLKTKADFKLSLSLLTFTHQMIRLLLVEQLYRAMTILRNEKYHHD